MKTRLLFAGLIAFCCIICACDENDGDISAPIAGTWLGNQAEFRINPKGVIPAFKKDEDDFDIRVQFINDGVIILTEKNGESTSGTYQLNGRSLTVNIDYEFE